MITYLNGDATRPQGDGLKYIIHVCNNKGGWGAGFVLAISKRWKYPEQAYRTTKPLFLGEIQFCPVEDDIVVINMIAQLLYTEEIPLKYDALRECLRKVNQLAVENNATIHAPKFGAGLARGDWDKIEQMINDIITVPVFIYIY